MHGDCLRQSVIPVRERDHGSEDLRTSRQPRELGDPPARIALDRHVKDLILADAFSEHSAAPRTGKRDRSITRERWSLVRTQHRPCSFPRDLVQRNGPFPHAHNLPTIRGSGNTQHWGISR